MRHIRKVEIENIRGIAHMVIDLNGMTVLRGCNGSGKSSVIEAIRLVFAGGYDPLALRTGEDKGEVVLTGDDGTTIKRIINRAKRTSTLDIRSAAGERVAAPQGFIEQLSTTFSYDPLKFLRCSGKERFEYLKKTLDVNLQVEEALAISEKYFVDADVIYSAWDPKLPGLDRIAKLRKAVYDRRTKINQSTRDLEGSIRTMKASVPSLNADGEQYREAEARLASELSGAKSAWARAKQQAEDEASAEQRSINEWEQTKIAEIKAMAAERRTAIGGALAAAIAQLEGEHGPVTRDLTERHAEARKALSDYDRAVGAREAIAKLEAELKDSRSLGDKLTFVIDGLDEIERQKLAASPVAGVELRDGEIFIDGVAFDGVNTQRRYQVAIQLGAINAGELKFMVCDEMEHWDQANFDAFAEAAKNAGFQVVCAVVDDCALQVTTVRG